MKTSFVGKNIRNYRDIKKISQMDMVEETGYSRNTIMRIESGDTDPTFTQLSKISSVLGVSIETLLQPRCEVISCLNQKGGVGKSTLNAVIATTIKDRYPHKNVLIIDTDPQKSIEIFKKELDPIVDLKEFNVNKYTSPTLAFVDFINQSKKDYDFIIIDTAGSLNQYEFMATITELSDFILVPIEATEVSIAGSMSSINIVTDGQLRRSEKGLQSHARIVINKMKPNLLETKQIRTMEKIAGIKTLKTAISDRKRYFRELNLGKSIAKKGDVNDEVNLFIDEVLNFVKV